MKGKTTSQILSERVHLENVAKNNIEDKVSFIDSYVGENPPEVVNKDLWYLAKSLELMSAADVVVFAKDWEEYRGCKIEYEAALAYGVEKNYFVI